MTKSGMEGSGWAGVIRGVLAKDVPASLVVFLVAVPLCMGIALASGAPIMAGLIAGVVGGLVVGLFGGAPLLVSGPAAGLAVMVFGFINELGFAVTCAAVVVAGLVQMALGGMKVARTALAISPAVIHGMLAGIGILIVLGQLHIVLGGSPKANAWQNVGQLPGQLAQLHVPAMVLGLLTIGVLVLWQVMPASRLKQVPGPLVAVVAASAAAALWGADVKRVELAGDFFSSLQLPSLPQGNWGAFVVAALSLALVASAESLLSAVATDKMHTGPRANLDGSCSRRAWPTPSRGCWAACPSPASSCAAPPTSPRGRRRACPPCCTACGCCSSSRCWPRCWGWCRSPCWRACSSSWARSW